jgi:hypothetical protein
MVALVLGIPTPPTWADPTGSAGKEEEEEEEKNLGSESYC